LASGPATCSARNDRLPATYRRPGSRQPLSWSLFSDRKVPLNKVETDLTNQGIFTLSA
jgi:hypothetical protein